MELRKTHSYAHQGGWDRIALEITDGYLIPVLIRKPSKASEEYVIIAHHMGKSLIPEAILHAYEKAGKGIVLVDFWGLGENSSQMATRLNGSSLPAFHTLSRSLIWLGETMQGRWVREMEIVNRWLRKSLKATSVDIHAFRDLGPAALFYTALHDGANHIKVEDAPISYRFDEDVTENYYSMAIHVPGVLKWGDLLLAAAMTEIGIKYVNPRSVSGKPYDNETIRQFIKDYTYFKRELGIEGRLEIK